MGNCELMNHERLNLPLLHPWIERSELPDHERYFNPETGEVTSERPDEFKLGEIVYSCESHFSIRGRVHKGWKGIITGRSRFNHRGDRRHINYDKPMLEVHLLPETNAMRVNNFKLGSIRSYTAKISQLGLYRDPGSSPIMLRVAKGARLDISSLQTDKEDTLWGKTPGG